MCPYDAIEFRVATGHIGTLQRPSIIEDKCVGCGLCGHHCPVGGQAAIYVERVGEERKSSGSYITAEKKRLRELKDDHAIDYFKEYGVGEAIPEPPKEETLDEEALPPGFLVE